MDEDARLLAQLKSLGKKMFQFRDLVSKIDIPEAIPPAPHDQIFWDMFVKKCASAVKVLKHIQSALLPDLYHLSVYPGEKIWRNPAAVPDLLSMPQPNVKESIPIACTRDEVRAWNTVLEEATAALETYLDSVFPSTVKSVASKSVTGEDPGDVSRIEQLFTMTSVQRASKIS